MKAVQLSSRVWQVNGFNPGPFTLQGTNTYVLGTGAKRILIDTGDGKQPNYFESLGNALRDSMGNAKISTILLTHWHGDHTGGLAGLLSQSFIDPDLVSSIKGTNTGMSRVYKRLDELNDKNWRGDMEVSDINVSKKLEQMVFEKKLEGADRQVILDLVTGEGNFSVAVEGATVCAVPTPGHTDEHISFYLVEENILFSGDCLLGKSSSIFNNLSNLINSFNLMLKLNPTAIYPGHGPIIDKPVDDIQLNIRHRLAREHQILKVMEDNTGNLIHGPTESEGEEFWYGLDSLFFLTYGPLQGEVLVRGAKYNLTNHLDKLIADQIVKSKTCSDGTILWAISKKQ
ncbi:hypothetical protein BB559_005251 [Furculomyces boomerangus]|uniref:Metallo-beta-lactamase domain-containing protein n=1 Tax=Furculomyces boomerangus TaxID=61424 RepID=A0A2T9Y9Q4_9FUNG|nr:hypothetical protein BB559_005251 [Furculomyces boomerangus]